MKKTIQILFIHQSSDLYGSDKTLLLLLKNLDKSSFNPIVILPNEGPLKTALEQEKVDVIIAPVLKLYRNMFSLKSILQFCKDYKKANKILDKLYVEHKFDIVYSNTLAVLLGLLFSKRRKIKHLWHVHEIIVHPKIIASIFPKLLYQYANIVVCNSNATTINLTSRNSKLISKTTTIYNGLEAMQQQQTAADRFGFKETDIIITLVGRISRLKGHLWLLKTFLKHLNVNPNVKMLFVGSTVLGQEFYLDEIKDIIIKNNLTEKVKVLDFKNNLYDIWKITDIAVMPSIEAESFGLVAVEAMLAKKPVIGSNHGGLTEIIINNETGFLIEPNNEIALADSLKTLIENPEIRTKFGENGYQRAIKHFSVETYVSSFEKLFTEIIKDGNKINS